MISQIVIVKGLTNSQTNFNITTTHRSLLDVYIKAVRAEKIGKTPIYIVYIEMVGLCIVLTYLDIFLFL